MHPGLGGGLNLGSDQLANHYTMLHQQKDRLRMSASKSSLCGLYQLDCVCLCVCVGVGVGVDVGVCNQIKLHK